MSIISRVSPVYLAISSVDMPSAFIFFVYLQVGLFDAFVVALRLECFFLPFFETLAFFYYLSDLLDFKIFFQPFSSFLLSEAVFKLIIVQCDTVLCIKISITGGGELVPHPIYRIK